MTFKKQPNLGLALMTSLLLVLFWFGMEQLQDIPPGMHPDVAENLADGLRISRSGTFPLYLQTRPEPVWRFFLALTIKWTDAVFFAGRFAGVLVTLVTAALTYRAVVALLRFLPWTTPDLRLVAGALSVSALISNVAFHFIFIQPYRALLLPCAIALLLLVWSYAWTKRTNRAFFLAGLAASIPINIYTAGLVVPPTVLLFTILMQFVLPRKHRLSWRQWGWLLFGMALAAAPQFYLALRIPNLYSRVAEAASFGNTQQSTLDFSRLSISEVVHKLGESIQTFYAVGFYSPEYNTQFTPFLNPILGVLVLVGIVVALRYWRRLTGVLVIGLILTLTIPGALSSTPRNPVHLSGTFVPLAALGGFGIAAVAYRLRKPIYGTILCIGVAAISIVSARGSFNAHWQDQSLWQDPQYWLSFPHYYSINYTEQLEMLRTVQKPVYVPLAQIDFPTAVWYLTRDAYPHVITSGSADTLPDGTPLPDADLWYPYAAEYNVPITTPAEQFVLLLPGSNGRDGSIVILPPIAMGAADALAQRAKREGTLVQDKTDILLGWWLPVHAADVTAPAQPDAWYSVNARFGDELELVGYEAPRTVMPGEKTRVTLYWRVLQPLKVDLFDFAVFLDANGTAGTPVDTWMFRWLYPSVFWQVNDILPQVVWIPAASFLPEGLVQLESPSILHLTLQSSRRSMSTARVSLSTFSSFPITVFR